ncbi:hypothetical protein PoB_005191600 [Plakobranchus ocellatus]|uniref:Reverse transcriptase zinc-binding domain-containing protein n=1 Tax=Plakobranchus ocellatus TaxID=259542 RepID=A0AAV4C205_9GAST|nr:hypothetical protein PoB_005191600 [Plakobranchus ocellatus]
MKENPICPLCQDRQTTEHVLSSCKLSKSQGRFITVCLAKGVPVRPEPAALDFCEKKESNPTAGKMQAWRCTKECLSDRSQQRWVFMKRRNPILLLVRCKHGDVQRSARPTGVSSAGFL